MPRQVGFRRTAALVAAVGLAATLAACGSSEGSTDGDSTALPSEVRLGYFATITHAPALVGVDKGYFADELGSDTKLSTTVFNAGPAVVEAMLSGSLDIAYVGPNPAINGYVQSKGEAVRVVAGSTSGGASFIVKPGIDSPEALKGKTVSTPQLGNTQDVALRFWAKEHNLATSDTGEGDFAITPQKNSQTVTAFQQGQLDGAWVPEPFASTMVVKGGGKVLVDERSEWPEGKFATAVVMVSSDFLKKYPSAVEKILAGHIEAIQYIKSDPVGAQAAINEQLVAIAGEGLDQAVLDRAWGQIDFTEDPLADTIATSADHAVAVGQLDQSSIDAAGGFGDLVDVTQLNKALKAADLPEITTKE